MYETARPGYGAAFRRNSFSMKEKQIWVIRGRKTKGEGNNRRRPGSVSRKSEH